MMRMLLTTLTLGAVLMPVVPADAQVYPERIRSVTRSVHEEVRVARYQGERRETRTERLEKTIRVSGDAELMVANVAGDVVITRGGGSEISIEAVKTGRGRTAEEAEAALKAFEVEIVERGNRVEVRGRFPERSRDDRRRSFSGSVAFTISAPEGTRVNVNSVSGNISVTGITGELGLETVSGNVEVARAGRLANAKSVSGNVTVTDTTIEGALDSGSVSGNVILRNVSVERLDASSVSGNVILEDVRARRIDAESLSGDVRLSGPLASGGRYELSSHSGNIRIQLSGDTGFEVDATSFSGAIRTDIELQTRTGSGRQRRSLHGIHGDGSAILELTTFSGNIIIGR